MISNKAFVSLFLIILNMQRAAASTPGDAQGSSSSDKPVPLKSRRRAPKSKNTTPTLQDADSAVKPVEAQVKNSEGMSASQEPLTLQVSKEFEELVKQGKYGEVFALGKKMKMSNDEFTKLIFQAVKTFEQYEGLNNYMEHHDITVSFYLHGDIEVVKEVIVKSGDYNKKDYFRKGPLETALPLALANDDHDRVVRLLNIRQEVTAKKDEEPKQKGWTTSFGRFVHDFLLFLAPWKDSIALRRFLAFRGGVLRAEYPGVLDTLGEKLVDHLRFFRGQPEGGKLFTDLVAQPSLLTPTSFAKGILELFTHDHRLIFIECGWREAIKEGLKGEYEWGGEKLWQAIKEKYPDQIIGEFSPNDDALAAVLENFQEKEHFEKEWSEKNVKMLFNKLLIIGFDFLPLPNVLWLMIFEYAISLIEI